MFSLTELRIKGGSKLAISDNDGINNTFNKATPACNSKLSEMKRLISRAQ